MSIRIYSTTYTTPLPPEILDPLLTNLPPDITAKARRYRRWQDAYGCIFGRLLLTIALKAQGQPAHLHQLQYTAYGRPYLPDTPDFNISHSAHRVVCAIADTSRIGIDLEEIRDLNIEDFKDQFTPEEWQAITHAAPPPARLLPLLDGKGMPLKSRRKRTQSAAGQPGDHTKQDHPAT